MIAFERRLAINSIIMMTLAVVYVALALWAIVDEWLADLILYYASDAFAWLNPFVLLSTSAQVRALFLCHPDAH